MTRKEAAQILGIGVNDDLAQVKKAYRKLAMRYHPDHNSSEEAKARFIEIHDAYSYLTDVASGKHKENDNKRQDRSQYGPDWKRDSKTYAHQRYKSREEFEKRFEEARRMADEMFERKSNAIYARALEDYKVSWKRKFTKYFAPFAALLALLLSIDYFLPTTPSVRTDTYVYYDEGGWGANHFLKYGMRHCAISVEAYLILHDQSSIATIHHKPILGHAQKIDIVTERGDLISVIPSTGIHRFFPFINFLLILPLLSLFIEKAKFWFVFFVTYANLYVIPSLFLIILYRMLS